ncbi:FAD-dependent oxidoreductase [Sphingobacterium olei]|uniref:FAD-dependent oxidoreductase n=1 Tax=Sphingobacterium olei TaxID=2571155 RepID=A0A4U0NKF2_9SPHI|nr:FAD-dependent oxidoreductase [Sphingobacterium olei]TJZ54776.1 FAD-dependent oxidoreductase [Sphingobacterium olei]
MKKYLLYLFTILVVHTATATSPQEKYDICVYGESASGVIAAVQAGRLGKKVILISKTAHVGGLATSGLTATDMNRNDKVGGITREFYQRIFQYYQQPESWKNQERDAFFIKSLKRTYKGKNDEREMQWVYESHIAEKIMLDMLREAGVELLFNERIDLKKGVKMKKKQINSLLLESDKQIQAKVFIDASYEGDLLAQSGVSYTVGRENNTAYNETLNGYRINYSQGTDLSAIDPYIKKGDKSSGLLPLVDAQPTSENGQADKKVQAYCYRVTLTDDPNNRVKVQKPANYNALWYEILARQLELNPQTELQKIITLTPMPNRKTDTNHLDFFGASYDYAEANYEERAKIEQAHRDYALGMLWFLEHDERVPAHIRKEMSDWGLAKDEFNESGHFPYQIYVREARRMIGTYVMHEKNVSKENRKNAEHPIGLGSYALDCHYVSRVVDKDGKLRNEGTIFQPVTPYPISYYAITPKQEECTNLLVTVCMSASHVAYSSIRMEPVYMILGQSAAVAASMAIDGSTTVQKVSYEKLADQLIKDQQIIHLSN